MPVFIFCLNLILLTVCFWVERNWLSNDAAAIFSLGLVPLTLAYLYFLYNRSFAHFCVSFYISFYFFFIIVSVVFINFGIPMVELRQVGEPNGSGWFAFMSFYVFTELSYFSFLLVSSSTLRMSIPKLPVSQEKMLSIFCVSFVLALSFYVLLRYSSPLLLGVD